MQLHDDTAADFDIEAAIDDAVNPSIDWIHEHFTDLFSINTTVNWIQHHMRKNYSHCAQSFTLDGFGRFTIGETVDKYGSRYYHEYDAGINKLVAQGAGGKPEEAEKDPVGRRGAAARERGARDSGCAQRAGLVGPK